MTKLQEPLTSTPPDPDSLDVNPADPLPDFDLSDDPPIQVHPDPREENPEDELTSPEEYIVPEAFG